MGRKVELSAVIEFDLCKSVILKATIFSQTVSIPFFIHKGMNTWFIQPNNSNKTMLVNVN